MTKPDSSTALWDTDVLFEIARVRLNLLEQLHALGQRQLEFIDQGDMTQLIQALSAKHHVLAELQQTEKRLDPFRGQNPEARRWRDETVRQRCSEVIERADRLLREVLAQEKQGETELERHRDETARRLQAAHAAGQARSAYTRPVARTGRLDLSSDH